MALGVGLLAAILTLNASMDKALEAQLAKMFGTFDLMVGYREAGVRLSETDLTEIVQQPGVEDAAGILIPYMYESHPELRLDLPYYGVTDIPLGQQFMALEAGSFPGSGEVALSSAWAKREGYQIGDTIRMAFPPYAEQDVKISGLLISHKRLSAGIALFERGWLERATGRRGSTFVLVDTVKGTDQQRLVANLQQRFPKLEYDVRKYLDEMRKNLNALRPMALGMGLASLLASAFLVIASFRMSLAERTRELALLRAVGATPGQVRRLILLEALILGITGSLAGAMAGVIGAIGATGSAARLLAVEPVPAVIPGMEVAGATVAGIILAVLSAVRVATAAGRVEPLRAMRPDRFSQEQIVRRGGRFGLLLLAVGVVITAMTPLMPKETMKGALPPLTGSTGALAIALGLLLGVQRYLPFLLLILSWPFRKSAVTRIAVRSLLRHRARSGLTIGALGLGLVLVLSIGTMSSSLIGKWYEQVHKEHPADIHLEVPSVYPRGVNLDFAQKVAATPGLTLIGTVEDQAAAILSDYDWAKAEPDYLKGMEEFEARHPDQPVRQRDIFWVNSADLPSLIQIGSYRIVEGSVDSWGEGTLALTRAYAESLGLKVGDRIRLNVKQAPPKEAVLTPEIWEFTVSAIVESDSWRMPRMLVAKPFPGAEERIRMVYANAAPEQRAEARQQVQSLIQIMEYNLVEYSDAETATAELRNWTKQRFALVLAVGLIMAAVAMMSLINTIANSVNERKRELALLRSVGATPGQVRKLVLIEAGLLGLVGGTIGVVGGAILGTGALFGLDLPLSSIRLPWSVIAGGLAVSLLLALIAALIPARQVVRIEPAESVRIE